MKRIKKLASLMLAAIMTLAMAIPAMANSVNVTITLPDDELLKGHTFTAYQIFTGTQTDDTDENELAGVEWASEINAEDFLTALKGIENSPFAACTTAADVAKVLSSDPAPSAAVLEKVAQLAYDNKQGNGTTLVAGPNTMPAGYYVIVDTTENLGADAVRNAALLAATKNVTVQTKTDKPTLEKKIIENGQPVDFNNGAIGQVVNYQLKSTVPDMSHYENYKFVVNDVMGKGLTFGDDVEVTVGGVEAKVTVTKEEVTDDYKAAHSINSNDYDGGTAIKIVFNDFFETYKNSAGAEIIVTYTGTINKDAVIGTAGNPNQASLKYPNNPNEVGEGDDFNGTEPSGNTPWDETRTFVTAVELFKTDENGKALSGAQFKITGTKLITTLVTGVEYVVQENGGYWQIKDAEGNISYTDVSPSTQGLTQAALNRYVDPDVQYAKETIARKETTGTAVNATAEVGEDGILRIEGLAAGNYEITEVMAPNGYNMLAKPILLTITYDDPTGEGVTNCTWSGTYDMQDGEGEKALTLGSAANNFALSFSVQNQSGSVLPSTGGIGTTIFYVVGGILVVAAGILLVTKKRMSAR
ncbi:MAG: isopeptide-forming domain-containing fimbrial protein [Lachnospiraceae bacterium]|nr:isopeptide-forming domain-containing fimbrial protein [Lachnospiraceae bacterium]